MEICERCNANSEEVRLFDAIYENKSIYLCERCSIIENIPIIKKPSSVQLKEAEVKVYDRLKRITGFSGQKTVKKDTYFKEDKLKEIEKNPFLEVPEKQSLNLIDFFHWEIMRNRRRKGLTQKQFAQAIGESETSIQLIENAKLPGNAEPLIKKIEQFLQIRLRKAIHFETFTEKQPILIDDKGQEIDIIPEEEMIFVEPKIKKESEEQEKIRKITVKPVEIEDEIIHLKKVNAMKEDFDLKQIDSKRVTIGELQKIHKRRIETTKQEQIEEQRKIEERRKTLEALREKERLKIDEIRKKELDEKRKLEYERKKLIEENKRRLEEQKRKESEDIDKYLGGFELIE